MATIQSIATLMLDGDWIESKDQADYGIRLIQTGNIGNGEYLDKQARAKYISEETFTTLKCTALKENDILISRLPDPVGRACLIPASVLPAITAVDCTILRLDNTVCDNNFFVYYTQSTPYQNQLTQFLAGTTRTRISRKNLEKIKIPLPPLYQQKEIVAILDKVSDLIALRKQQLAKLDELVKARFVEMFDIQNCKRKKLGECTDFVDYRGHTPELSDTGTIRMVNAKSVGKGFFKHVDEYVTEETYNSWMRRGFGYPGDILFVTEGHTFGNTCLIPDDLEKFALGQRVITIKGHQEMINTFLCSYMQTDMFWKDINVYRTGGTAQGIRSKDLAKVDVPIPPLEQQKQFADFVEQTDKSKSEIQTALTKLETLKKALMQQYFG